MDVCFPLNTSKPEDFLSQTMLNLPNMWGIIKYFAERLLKEPDGKY